MKKILIVAAAIMMVSALGGIALAGGTTTVNVSANIVGTCQFSTTPTLAFGPLDQTSSSDATATGTLSFWCTNGAPYILSDSANPGVGDGSYSGTISNGTDNITYSIGYDSYNGNGDGKSFPISSTLNATIPKVNFANVTAGAYTGTVQFTIAP